MDDQQSYSSANDPFGLSRRTPQRNEPHKTPRFAAPQGLAALTESPVTRASTTAPMTAGKPTDEVDKHGKRLSRTTRTVETDSITAEETAYRTTTRPARLWTTAEEEQPPRMTTVTTAPSTTPLSQLSESPHNLVESTRRMSLNDRLSARRRSLPPQPPRVTTTTETSYRREPSYTSPPAAWAEEEPDAEVRRLSMRYQQLARDLLQDQESTWRRQQEALATQQESLRHRENEFRAQVQAWQEEQDQWYAEQEEERRRQEQLWREDWQRQRAKEEAAWRRERSSQEAEWQAQVEQQEEMLAKVKEERTKEETALQEAVQKRQSAMALAEKIASDSDKVQDALELRLQKGRAEYAETQAKIEQGQHELQSLKERIQIFMREDRQTREAAAADAAAAREALSEVRAQTEQQRRLLQEEQDELASVRKEIAQKREDWAEEEQNHRREKERFEMEMMQAREEQEGVVRSTRSKLLAMEAEMTDKLQQWESSLEKKAQHVEMLQGQVLFILLRCEKNFTPSAACHLAR